jgi:hypothetical protein
MIVFLRYGLALSARNKRRRCYGNGHSSERRKNIATGDLRLSGSAGRNAQDTMTIKPEASEWIDCTLVSIDTFVSMATHVVRSALSIGVQTINDSDRLGGRIVNS